MAEVDISQTPPRLLNVFPIDNCPSKHLIMMYKQEVDDSFLDGGFGLFDNQESDKTPFIGNPPIEKEPVIDYEKAVNGFHEKFKVLFNKQKILAQHFQKNLEKEILQHEKNLDEYQLILQKCEEHFCLGLADMFETIKADPNFLQKFAVKDSDDKNLQRVAGLIEKKLKPI